MPRTVMNLWEGQRLPTDRQYERLRRVGCDIGQGFLMSRPLDRGAIRTYLGQARTTDAA